jgi:hypothetical protein
MRKLRLLILSVLVASPIALAASPAHACTSQIEPDGCEVVNRVCRKLGGGNCLG